MVLTIACYSGGWICHTDLHGKRKGRTVNGARTDGRSTSESEVRRPYGPMYTRAIAEELTKFHPSGDSRISMEDDDEIERTEEQMSLCEKFYMLWRTGWGSSCGFKNRWEQLEDEEVNSDSYQASHSNEESLLTQLDDCNCINSNLYGGTFQSWAHHISVLAEQYLASYQGFDCTGPNGGLHNRLNMIQMGKLADPQILVRCFRHLEYRMTQMAAADDYLRIMEIPAPQGLRYHEFYIKGIENKIGKERYQNGISMVRNRKVLFPEPIDEQGRHFDKGPGYLSVAFHFAGLETTEIGSRLDVLAMLVTKGIEYRATKMRDIPEIESQKKNLFVAFGVD
ncbi:MAG: hypothetical protein Q9213_001424 [Squamulea squamosa]